MKKIKIYTKTGDKGKTALYSGDRVEKSHVLIQSLGAIDECNSHIGNVVTMMKQHEKLNPYMEQLIFIQHVLFDLGAAVATPRMWASDSKVNDTQFSDIYTNQLEQWVDQMDETLPPLKNFILPGGHIVASNIHICRSITRKAESFISSIFTEHQIEHTCLSFLNRLSDYFFMLARTCNNVLGVEETIWEKGKTDA